MATRNLLAISPLRSPVIHTNHGLKPHLYLRQVHSSQPKSASAIAHQTSTMHLQSPSLSPKHSAAALHILPLSQIIRSYLITRATSSPILLRASFAVLKRMLNPNSVVLNPDYNPFLRYVFKHTFYTQFCAGENRDEVQRSIAAVKQVGYTGVMLEYALEVLAGEQSTEKSAAEALAVWRSGMLASVDMCSPGDFVGLKWSGIGSKALALLNAGEAPTKAMDEAMKEVCSAASKKDVGLLPGAELEKTNVGIDQWTIELQRRFNTTPGHAIVYTTYQSYLKSTPARLARDLAVAKKDGFTLGIKLVRGAYLVSEPRNAVLDSKEATDEAYDALVAAVLTRQYNDTLEPSDGADGSFPQVSLMIASHNAVSVAKARAIRDKQAASGQPLIELSYAQLQGMADEISCSLVAASQQRKSEAERNALSHSTKTIDVPRPFKCATWGTVGQCLNFLYRRAYENQDAAGRTAETRNAMGRELWRRGRAVFGLHA